MHKVTSNAEAYVCDLGVAKFQNILGTIKTSKGPGAVTVPYKAPEVFMDGKRSTPVDIYAFGCTMIELLSGKRVWGELSAYQITAKVCGSYNAPPQSPCTTEVPEECRELCSQCTLLEPTGRPSALRVVEMLKTIHS